MTTVQSRMEALMQGIAEESASLTAQLAKSAAARAASPPTGSTPPAATHSAASPPLPLTQPAAPPPKEISTTHNNTSSSSDSRRVTKPSASPSPSSPTAGPAVVVVPVTATQKQGTLLHLVRSSGLFGTGGSVSFVPHYVVVSGSSGIAWYASRADYEQQPRRPLGQAAFWIETYNSRGSRFKKAAVCWPLILPEDCPAATDPTKTYFAVDYYVPSGAREQLVFAAASPAERDAWVQLLTKYIDLYLAPRAESEELQHFVRGAAVPLHKSGVLEGEAPGGNIL